MSKIIVQDQEAREKMLAGVKVAADTVGSTLGPRGHNVAIDRGYDMWVIHDGVNVFRQIELKDPLENAGVRIVREAANKQVEAVGDGTTVVTILSHAIIEESLKAIAGGVNAMSLRKGLEAGRDKLINKLSEVSTPVKTLQALTQVATISAEDGVLGVQVAELLHKLGEEAVITVDESKSADTFVEMHEGMQLDKGYISPYFVTDPVRMESTIDDCYILITDQTISNINDLLPLINERIAPVTRNFVIIAQDVTDSALASCVATKLNGGMNVLCVQAPLFAQKQKDILQDIAVLTGGQVISGDADMRFQDVTLEQLGRAQRVTSTKDATIIIGGMGDPKDIKERAESIRAQIDRAEGSEFEQDKLQERIGKLTSGVAVLKVGGQTEVEMKERKERALDAVASTRAAMQDGIVPGGEVIYLQIRDVLDKTDIAEKILFDALAKPFKKLVENAGYDGGEKIAELKNQSSNFILDSKNMPDQAFKPGAKVFVESVKDSAQNINNLDMGFDVIDGEFKDLIAAGIIDPVRVSKSAILNSVSVAIQIMTTATLIVPEPKEETKK